MIFKTGTIIRWLIGVSLLYFVWANAHWSVALCLTLMGIRVEITDVYVELKEKLKEAKGE